MKHKTKKTDTATIANKYGVTERTVRNWRKENAPLSDPRKLSAWLASRKHCPKSGGIVIADEQPPASKVEPLARGAAAALSRLETAEAAAYSRLESVLPTHDAIEIRNARESWLKLCHNLRLYESAVEFSRRDLGLLVEKADVLKALGTLAAVLRLASLAQSNELGVEIANERDIHRCRALIRKCGYDVALLSFAAAEAMGIPPWMMEPFKADYVSNLTTSRPELDAVFEGIGDAIKQSVGVRIATEPHYPAEPTYQPPTPPAPPAPPATGE